MVRTPTLIGLLTAAVGVPYTATETDLGRSTVQMITGSSEAGSSIAPVTWTERDGVELGTNSLRDVEGIWEQTIDRYRYGQTQPLQTVNRLASSSNRDATQSAIAPGMPVESYSVAQNSASLVGQPVQDLREVLRFDISPDWVTQRFSRVSTVLAELNLDGLRVPLVTGTAAGDLAGSISYYFDRQSRLQRVMLHGFTGDATSVVNTMTQFYGLQLEPSLDAGVYTRKWNGRPVHFLRITRAPIVYSDATHHKFIIFLELNQPDLGYGISEEAQRIMSADHSTGRW